MRFSWNALIIGLAFALVAALPSQNVLGQSAIVVPSPDYAASDIFLDRAPEAFGAFGTNLALFERSTGLEVANPADGSALLSLGMPSDYFAQYANVWSSFIVADPRGNSLWVGFNTFGNTDDRIYQVDLNGQWTQKAALVGNFDMQFSGTTAYISANASGLGTSNNTIWQFNSVASQLAEVAHIGGYSAGLGADSLGNVYYGTYGFTPGNQSLYRFSAEDILQAVLNETPLTSANAEKLADFVDTNGPGDLDVDAADNVVFNLNVGDQSGSAASKIAIWNGTVGSGPNYDVIGTGGGQSRWYTMLETAGDVRELGGKVFVQDYFSPGIAQMIRTANCWDGGSTTDSLWNTPENWSTDAAPQADDHLYFAGSTRLTAENDFSAGTAFAGITFTSSAGPFHLTGNQISLADKVANESDQLQTLELGITIGSANLTFETGVNGIALKGVMGEAAPGADLTKTGAGTLTLSQANTYSGETHIAQGNLLLLGSIAQTSVVDVAPDAQLTLAGTSGSSLSPGTGIDNNGLVVVIASGQKCGNILGSGSLFVQSGADLTAGSIVQSTLSIGGAQTSHAVPEPNSLLLLITAGIAVGACLLAARLR